MSKWFYANIVLVGIAIWHVISKSSFSGVPIHLLAGLLGALFVLFNWTRQAVFSTIRNTPDRNVKIKLASLSKKIVPYHRWVGTLALVIIIIHAILVIHLYGFYWENPTFLSGFVTGIALVGMVTTGWLRLIKPSVKKRRAHIYFGMALFFLLAIHIIL
ncbi:hypothetical protein [Oceanobacillus halotolerans]|uniref:hypothetical protein n=1 Tax=Oceanobacillus halotolerans TaxID=2663380 RepID=UPI0013DD4EA6|nr:hypothetical protein [Oceanobacillus halotolerans]